MDKISERGDTCIPSCVHTERERGRGRGRERIAREEAVQGKSINGADYRPISCSASSPSVLFNLTFTSNTDTAIHVADPN